MRLCSLLHRSLARSTAAAMTKPVLSSSVAPPRVPASGVRLSRRRPLLRLPSSAPSLLLLLLLLVVVLGFGPQPARAGPSHADEHAAQHRLAKYQASSTASAPEPTGSVVECFEVHQAVPTPGGLTVESAGRGEAAPADDASDSAVQEESCSVVLMEHDFAYSYGEPFVGWSHRGGERARERERGGREGARILRRRLFDFREDV